MVQTLIDNNFKKRHVKLLSKPYLKFQHKGFTLLELLVVMVIIGLLAAFVGPRYFSQIGKSEIKVARAQMVAFEQAIEQYKLDTGHFPSSEQGLKVLEIKPENEKRWDGPYLKKKLPLDPWGNAYIYSSPGEHGDYDIFSYGNDGRSGGDSEATDLGNW